MANVILLAGESSTGKTHSLKSLDPSETLFIQLVKKRLPWRGSSSQYSTEKKNLVSTKSYLEVIEALRYANDNQDITNVIIDDVGFMMSKELFRRAMESGYGKFSDIARQMQMVLETAESLRDSLNIAIIFHEEKVLIDGYLPERKIKTIGRMIDDKYEPQATVSIVLFTKVTFDKDKNPVYEFVTNRTPEYPAKSPEGMFEQTYIPNDMEQVFTISNEYYNNNKTTN